MDKNTRNTLNALQYAISAKVPQAEASDLEINADRATKVVLSSGISPQEAQIAVSLGALKDLGKDRFLFDLGKLNELAPRTR